MSRKPKHPRKKPPPYYRQRFLCSAGEWRFCQKLEQAVGDRFVVMMQVSVAALVRVPAESWKRHGMQMAPLRFDFVLVERGSSFAAAAIELDDKTHLLPERQRRDAFLNEACELAGLPLIRIKAAQRYNLAELRETVKAHLPKGATEVSAGDTPKRDKNGKPTGWVWKRVKSRATVNPDRAC